MNGRSYSGDNVKLAGGELPVQEVAKDVNAITYIGHAYAKAKGIKTVSINGIAPPADRVNDYPYTSRLILLRPIRCFARSQSVHGMGDAVGGSESRCPQGWISCGGFGRVIP